jgi:hypothetical protein
MSKISVAIFMALLLMTVGCGKDMTVIIPVDITGNWQWTSTLYDLPLGPANPSTPLNGGSVWSLTFYNDNTWKSILGIVPDTGTYSLGHGSYTDPSSHSIYSYDSVAYYHLGTTASFKTDYYKIYHTDSLVFSTSFIGVIGGDIISFHKQ